MAVNSCCAGPYTSMSCQALPVLRAGQRPESFRALVALRTCWGPKQKCPALLCKEFMDKGMQGTHPCRWITTEEGWFAGSPLLLRRVFQPGSVSCVLSAFPTSSCCTSSTSQTLCAKNIGFPSQSGFAWLCQHCRAPELHPPHPARIKSKLPLVESTELKCEAKAACSDL